MKTVVITGASSGIGQATAVRLAASGCRVFAGVRAPESAPARRGVTPVRLDITDPAAIAGARATVLAALDCEPLTGLVNNAGSTVPGPVEYLALEGFRRQVKVNLTGQVAAIQPFLPLLARPGGRIVIVSSPGAKIGAPFMAPYVAAKAGLDGLSAVLRFELAHAGIEVAVIEPGYVASEMRHKLQRDTDAALARLPDDGAARYGPALRAVTDGIIREAAHGADPGVVARAIHRALTDRHPRTVYPAGPRAGRLLLPTCRPAWPGSRPARWSSGASSVALHEWWRRAELSADRAGLLAGQDPAAALRAHMKLAGGSDLSEIDTTAFWSRRPSTNPAATSATACTRSG